MSASVLEAAFRAAAARGTIRARVSDLEQPTSAILLAVSGLLGREIAIDDLLRSLVDRIAQIMGADRGTLYLVDRRTNEVFSRAAMLPEIEEIRLPMGQGVAGQVAKTGEVINVPAPEADTRFFGGVDQKTGYRTTSILAVPVSDRSGQIIGVIQLLNKQGGPFDASDIERLGALATQVAVALETTSVYPDLWRRPDPESPVPLDDRFNLIVGESQAIRSACRLISKAAPTEATVLIQGESGTGKGVFARALHVNSKRRDGPFVKVDCASLPATLIDNELFGHEKGAYTGAEDRAIGKFDAAKGGTLFLDELGELPLEVQGKLLRVLQDKEFQRVGGTETVSADVRVVAATNRDLESMIAEGRFRQDLYYRIKVVQMTLPPLRKRGGDDVERLTRHFVHASARRNGVPVPVVSPAALSRLRTYDWPGNVRELENCLESALIMMEDAVIRPEDLPLAERPQSARAISDDRVLTLEEVERRHIVEVLAIADGNRSEAAKLLGIGRNTLTRKLNKYDDG